MATPSFFLVYKDDEGHIEINRLVDEQSAVKTVHKIYKQTGRIPLYMIRGESRPVTVQTTVRFEEPT